jgi:hypothetical protein
MEAMTARAILALRLLQSGPEKLDALRAYEKSLDLPPGRYLLGFEIMRWIRQAYPQMKIENPSENESMSMDSMWRDYDKTHIQNVAQLTLPVIHCWEDWAMDHFVLEPGFRSLN